MDEQDPDIYPTVVETDLMLLQSQLYWLQEETKLLDVDYVGQDLSNITVPCEKCHEIFMASDSEFEKVGEITHMKCPICLTPFKELSAGPNSSNASS